MTCSCSELEEPGLSVQGSLSVTSCGRFSGGSEVDDLMNIRGDQRYAVICDDVYDGDELQIARCKYRVAAMR